MVVTTYGKAQAALRLGSNIQTIGWVAVGSGSGAVGTGNINLVAEIDRNAFTSDGIDYSSARKIAFASRFTSVEMSGTQLREFGAFSTGTANTGSLWNREGFAAVNFDGTNELEVEISYEVY